MILGGHNTSVRMKVTLTMMALVTGLMVSGAFVVYHGISKTEKAELTTDLQELALVLSPSLSNAIVSGDTPLIRKVLLPVSRRGHSNRSASVYNVDGMLLADTTADQFTPITRGHLISSGTCDVWLTLSGHFGGCQTLMSDGAVVGSLLIETDLSALKTRQKAVIDNTLLYGGAFLLLSFLLAARIGSQVTRPLRRLTATIEDMVRTGDLTHDIGRFNNDEIGVLASSFGQLTGWLSGDISYRAETEEKMTRLLAEHDAFQSTLPDIAYMTDTSGKFTWCNERALEVTGLTEEQVLSITNLDLIDERDHGKILPPPSNRDDQAVRKSEARVKTVDGPVLYEFRSAVIRDEDGIAIGAAGIGRDLSEQRKAESIQRSIISDISAETGQDYLQSLVRVLAEELDVRYALIAEFSGSQLEVAQTVAVWADGALGENFSYDLKGTPCAEVQKGGICVHPNDVQRLFPEDKLLIDMGVDSYLGVRLLSPDGTTLGIMAVLDDRPLIDVEVAESVTNIFALRAGAELSRVRSEVKLRQAQAIFENSSEGMIIVDAEKRILSANPAFLNVTGYSQEEILGETPAILQSGRHTTDFYRSLWAGINETGKWSGEIWNKRKDGTIFPELVNISVVHDKAGNITNYVAAYTDIQEIKETEFSLLENERLLRESQEIGQIGHWSWDVATGRIHWSDQIFRIFGHRPNEFEATYERFIGVVHPDDLDRVNDSVNRAFDEGEKYSIDHRIVLPDDTIRWVHEEAVATVDAEGNRIQMMGTVQDITKQHLAEIEQMELQQQLLQIQKMESLGQLTGGIAHDFNNLLASIFGYIGMAKLVADSDDEGKLPQYLDQIDRVAKRARDLVARMLLFSRTDDNEGEMEQTAPYALIEEVLRMMRPMLPSSVEIGFSTEKNLPLVAINPVSMYQAIMNLCVNARDAMDGQGRIDIELKRSDYSEHKCDSCFHSISGNFVELSIRDTGTGIDEALRKHLFEPFFTTKDIDKGTGLGLSVVHGTIHDHGGHIIVESEEDSGTVFRLLLPISEHDHTLENPINEVYAPDDLIGNGQHILVVDDEEDIAEITKEILEDHGYKATALCDSRDALDYFQKHSDKFDLVLTDQTMPGLTGIQMVQGMRKIRSEIPTILWTGHSEHVDEGSAAGLGINGFIKKPVDNDELLRVIKSCLD